MSKFDEKLDGFLDTAAGKAKRALGELSGRPDIVLEGEAQETLGHKERLEADVAKPKD